MLRAPSRAPPEISIRNDVPSLFRVSPNDRLLAAALDITGTELGDFRLVTTHSHADDFVDEVLIKEGAEPVFHVVPAPPTLAILAVGAIGALRRRRVVD